MKIDWTLIILIGRLILINIVPFILVFHMVMKRRRQLAGEPASDVQLIAGELKIVGFLGYFVILSVYFFSIPTLDYMNTQPGHRIQYVEPEPSTVLLTATISFFLVVSGMFMQAYKYWAYHLAYFFVTFLIMYAFFSTLHYGFLSLIPILLFCYLHYRLEGEALRKELKENQ